MITDDLNFIHNPYKVLNVNTDADDQTILSAFESSEKNLLEEKAYKLIKDRSARLRYALLLPYPISDEELFKSNEQITPVYRSPGFWYDAVTSLKN